MGSPSTLESMSGHWNEVQALNISSKMSHLRRDVERLSERVLPFISNKATTEGPILTVIREIKCSSTSARVAAGSVSPKIGRKHCCINVAESAKVKLEAKQGS